MMSTITIRPRRAPVGRHRADTTHRPAGFWPWMGTIAAYTLVAVVTVALVAGTWVALWAVAT